MAQHMQDPAAFIVEMSIEQLKAIIVVNVVDDGTTVIPIFFQVTSLEIKHRLFEVISPLIVFTPQILAVGSKALVQPSVSLVATGEQVSKPLMRQFVGYD